MQAPARCACWLRSGPGPLAAQDRPPQSPPPHRTALLCSSSSGPDAASGARGVGGGTGPDMGAETGGRDHDSECSSMVGGGGGQSGRGQTYARQSGGVESGQSGGAARLIYCDMSDRWRPMAPVQASALVNHSEPASYIIRSHLKPPMFGTLSIS